MTYTEFLNLVTEMRQAQEGYFQEARKKPEDQDRELKAAFLRNSKRLEKLVDNAIAEGKFWDNTVCRCLEEDNWIESDLKFNRFQLSQIKSVVEQALCEK